MDSHRPPWMGSDSPDERSVSFERVDGSGNRYPPVHLALSIYRSTYLSIYLALSTYLPRSMYLSIYPGLYIYLSIWLYLSMYLCLPIYLPVSIYFALSIRLSGPVYLSISLDLPGALDRRSAVQVRSSLTVLDFLWGVSKCLSNPISMYLSVSLCLCTAISCPLRRCPRYLASTSMYMCREKMCMLKIFHSTYLCDSICLRTCLLRPDIFVHEDIHTEAETDIHTLEEHGCKHEPK